MLTLTIDGAAIDDIASFYDELNRVFMQGEDWRLGQSLDALNDMLHGGYGALAGADRTRVVWTDFEHSRRALGLEASRARLQAKLDHPEGFDVARIRHELDALERGEGQTYIEIVLEIFADHPNIELITR